MAGTASGAGRASSASTKAAARSNIAGMAWPSGASACSSSTSHSPPRAGSSRERSPAWCRTARRSRSSAIERLPRRAK